MVDFRVYVQQRLIQSGLTINALAKEAQVSRDCLYRWLKGKTQSIASQTLEKVLMYFGYTMPVNAANPISPVSPANPV